MKALNFIPALMIAAVALSGCDTVRSFFGKPTSKDIMAAKVKDAAEKAEADSIAKAEALAAETLRQQEEAAAAANAIHRYNVIVGSFKEKANADRMMESLTKIGENVIAIDLKNGMTAISVLNTDDFHEACRKLNSTYGNDDYPFDCWIYDAATLQHE